MTNTARTLTVRANGETTKTEHASWRDAFGALNWMDYTVTHDPQEFEFRTGELYQGGYPDQGGKRVGSWSIY